MIVFTTNTWYINHNNNLIGLKFFLSFDCFCNKNFLHIFSLTNILFLSIKIYKNKWNSVKHMCRPQMCQNPSFFFLLRFQLLMCCLHLIFVKSARFNIFNKHLYHHATTLHNRKKYIFYSQRNWFLMNHQAAKIKIKIFVSLSQNRNIDSCVLSYFFLLLVGWHTFRS